MKLVGITTPANVETAAPRKKTDSGMKQVQTALIAKLEAMPVPKRKKLHEEWVKWFDYEDHATPFASLKTAKSLADEIMNSDPLWQEGGLMDFLQEKKLITKAQAKSAAANFFGETDGESNLPEAVLDALEGHDLTVKEVQKIVDAINKKTGSNVTIGDYAMWYTGEGKGSVKKFDAAVAKLLGKKLAAEGDGDSRFSNLVDYALGLGPDVIGGISMKKWLQKAALEGHGPLAKVKSAANDEEVDLKAKPTSVKVNKALANKTISNRSYSVAHDANGLPTAASLRKLTVEQLGAYMGKHSKVTKADLIKLLRGE